MQTLALKSTQLIISWHFSGGRREKDTTHCDTQLLELSPRRQKKLHLLSSSCWAVRARRSTGPNPHLLGCSLQSGKLQSHAVDYARTIFYNQNRLVTPAGFHEGGMGREDRSQDVKCVMFHATQRADKVCFVCYHSCNCREAQIHITGKFPFEVGLVLQTSQIATNSIRTLLYTAH